MRRKSRLCNGRFYLFENVDADVDSDHADAGHVDVDAVRVEAQRAPGTLANCRAIAS